MRHQRIDLIALLSSDQQRPLVTEAVDKLAASIREVGLIQPITVKPCAVLQGGLSKPGYQIVAGHHRVAACRALGWAQIGALVIEPAEHLQAELIEIDENLCRAELTAAQRAQAIKRRRQIWEALHPEERQRVADLGSAEPNSGKSFPTITDHAQRGPGRPKEFASETAAVSGESKRAINQHLARADAIGDEGLTKIAGTSLDKGVEMDALARLPEPERAELIERAQAGECVSARDTATAKPAHKPAAAAPALTPSMRLQMALLHGIEQMLSKAGVETVEEFVAQIMALPVRERDFMSDQLDAFEYVGCLGSQRELA